MLTGNRVVRAARGVSVVQVVGPKWRVHLAGGGPVGPVHDRYSDAEAFAADLGMIEAAPAEVGAVSAEVAAAVAAERAGIAAVMRDKAAGARSTQRPGDPVSRDDERDAAIFESIARWLEGGGRSLIEALRSAPRSPIKGEGAT